MIKNEEFVLANRPKDENDLKQTWELREIPFPQAKDEGDFVLKTLYLSVDPYLSSGIKKSALGGTVNKLGETQTSALLTEVIESKNEKYPVGTIIAARLPWRRYNLIKKDTDLPRARIMNQDDEVGKLIKELGLTAAVSALGMPAQTAYYGAIDVGKFNESDVLVVSGCAGAVGSVVGQIAKRVLKVKKLIGVAGGKEKCELAVKELGFDYVIDYREYDTRQKMAARLTELTGPNEPITAYFDNTGGHTTDAVFDVIGRHGRIIICGQISAYNKNEDDEYTFPNYLAKTVYRGLSILGFVIGDFVHRNEQEFYKDMPVWIRERKVVVKETIVEGFEKTPEAYEMLFKGKNVGKVIVKV